MHIGDVGTVVAVNSTGVRLAEFTNASKGGVHATYNLVLHAAPVAKSSMMLLSGDASARKGTPITTGVLDYFPRAIAAVAQCSKAGNDQHNPGQPLHWAKEKSADHADCIARHLIDRHNVDTDGVLHATKLAWRALALLETALEEESKNAV
jgi:hypothetical protein